MAQVIFVGAGPGAADLITLRGAAALRAADVVLCDALTDPALRDLAPRAEWIDVGKRGFTGARTSADERGGSVGQDTINALLVRHARASGVVVRLKGGDPSVFGRLEEELEALIAAGIGFEIVPGVTAALAAAADTARPLTRRGAGRSVALTTAMTREGPAGIGAAAAPGEPAALGQAATSAGVAAPGGPAADTQVYYMAGKQLGALARRLAASGWPADTPVSVVSRAGWADALRSDHRVATLGHASVLHAGRPTVVVVGIGATPVGADGRRPVAPRAEAPGAAPLAPIEDTLPHVTAPDALPGEPS